MGAFEAERTSRQNEYPAHKEFVNDYWMSIYPITQINYERIMGINTSYFNKRGKGHSLVYGLETSQYPVDSVSWIDAMAFCSKLNSIQEEKMLGRFYRLPTEIEWEYACRAGTSTPFNIGNKFTSFDGNINGLYPFNSNIVGPTLNRPCEVGLYRPNQFGLYDMHGNIWEWCLNSFYTYSLEKYLQINAKVLRGGAWNCYSRFCRSAYRCISGADVHYYDCGFRIVCEIR